MACLFDGLLKPAEAALPPLLPCHADEDTDDFGHLAVGVADDRRRKPKLMEVTVRQLSLDLNV